MGGRGSAGSAKSSSKNATKMKSKKLVETVKKDKMPISGPKVQSAYIDYVKNQINVDLSKARENRFDDRSGFNIDTRKLSRSQYSDLQRLTQKNRGDYDVQLMNNGANRIYIRVKRKKKK